MCNYSLDWLVGMSISSLALKIAPLPKNSKIIDSNPQYQHSISRYFQDGSSIMFSPENPGFLLGFGDLSLLSISPFCCSLAALRRSSKSTLPTWTTPSARSSGRVTEMYTAVYPQTCDATWGNDHQPLKLEYPIRDQIHFIIATIFGIAYSMVPHPKQSATLPGLFLMVDDGWMGGMNKLWRHRIPFPAQFQWLLQRLQGSFPWPVARIF